MNDFKIFHRKSFFLKLIFYGYLFFFCWFGQKFLGLEIFCGFFITFRWRANIIKLTKIMNWLINEIIMTFIIYKKLHTEISIGCTFVLFFVNFKLLIISKISQLFYQIILWIITIWIIPLKQPIQIKLKIKKKKFLRILQSNLIEIQALIKYFFSIVYTIKDEIKLLFFHFKKSN